MCSEQFEVFQYNSCVSRGFCSLSLQNSALQTVLVLYLRFFSKFAVEPKVFANITNETKEFVLNTLSITIYNPEFNEKSFLYAVKVFRRELLNIMNCFSEKFPEKNIEEEKNEMLKLFQETENVILATKYGEKRLRLVQEKLLPEIRDLYNIMLVIAKSISINLLDLETFELHSDEAFLSILKLLSLINLNNLTVEELKSEIFKSARIDIEIMKKLYFAQEERYGVQSVKEVSYSTTPGKAVLVVGSNIRELESVLEYLKDKDIDVYTHDDMMLAHTFPKFSEYKHLKGQFGQGLENCLLDFATFPGPIILTKHSLHNIENFYRGRLFTTDYTTSPKGIIKINNGDFSLIEESVKESRGFKTGKQCESVVIGYDYSQVIELIEQKLSTKIYDKLFLIGLDGYSLEQKSYFEKLIKLTPCNTLIISFSYNVEKENLIHINACFDSFSIMRIFDYVKTLGLDMRIFFPKCDRNTISQMIYLSEFDKVNVNIGKCTPIILNPTLLNTLESSFNIVGTSSAKKDLEKFFNGQ